jgi:hypothetical protein
MENPEILVLIVDVRNQILGNVLNINGDLIYMREKKNFWQGNKTYQQYKY